MYPRREKEKVKLACSVCDHVEEVSEPEEYMLVREGRSSEEPRVIEGGVDNLPKVKVKCEKCGHDEAYWWTRQTRGADEPMTRFFRCTRCNHVWREYE